MFTFTSTYAPRVERYSSTRMHYFPNCSRTKKKSPPFSLGNSICTIPMCHFIFFRFPRGGELHQKFIIYKQFVKKQWKQFFRISCNNSTIQSIIFNLSRLASKSIKLLKTGEFSKKKLPQTLFIHNLCEKNYSKTI